MDRIVNNLTTFEFPETLQRNIHSMYRRFKSSEICGWMESALLFFFGKCFDLSSEMSRNSNQKFWPIQRPPGYAAIFLLYAIGRERGVKVIVVVDQKQEKCEPMSEP